MTISRTHALQFWTADYETGISALNDRMSRGIAEDFELSDAIAGAIGAERGYSAALLKLNTTSSRRGAQSGGQTVLRAFSDIREHFATQSAIHAHNADIMETVILDSFDTSATNHRTVVAAKYGQILELLKAYRNEVKKLQRADDYFAQKHEMLRYITETLPPEAEVLYSIGSRNYNLEGMGELLSDMLNKIPRKDVSVVGKSQDTSSGLDIASWIMGHFNIRYIEPAIKIGQDFLRYGFIKAGSLGSQEFDSDSRTRYQWTRKAFAVAGVVDERMLPGVMNDFVNAMVNRVGTNRVSVVGRVNTSSGATPDETPKQRAIIEKRIADLVYAKLVVSVDKTRCELEDSIDLYIRDMLYLEEERTNRVSDTLVLLVETAQNSAHLIYDSFKPLVESCRNINTAEDLQYFQRACSTGPYSPRTRVYSNRDLGNGGKQTFGVPLESRVIEELTLDIHKEVDRRLPTIMSAVYYFMEEQYAKQEKLGMRRSKLIDMWTQDVMLQSVHELRTQINNGLPFLTPDMEHGYHGPHNKVVVFDRYSAAIVAGLLKLYIMELPRPLVETTVFESLTRYYSNSEDEDGDERMEESVAPHVIVDMNQSSQWVLTSLITATIRLVSDESGTPSGSVRDIIPQRLAMILERGNDYSIYTLSSLVAHLVLMVGPNNMMANKVYGEALALELATIIVRSVDDSNRILAQEPARVGYRLLMDMFKLGAVLARQYQLDHRDSVGSSNNNELGDTAATAASIVVVADPVMLVPSSRGATPIPSNGSSTSLTNGITGGANIKRNRRVNPSANPNNSANTSTAITATAASITSNTPSLSPGRRALARTSRSPPSPLRPHRSPPQQLRNGARNESLSSSVHGHLRGGSYGSSQGGSFGWNGHGHIGDQGAGSESDYSDVI
ncbi:uncharacterized protein V1518DRAFT_411151 [Limtongia smithiae]|uniref:uncharacterized protein n=1 Tax=Limtongia smithiae TaxID=1125753 RepID=UPI0034CD37CB